MNSCTASKPIIIELNIGDQLTSISCGHVVVELIKFLLYQRQQIPYSYPWLKQVITKKKSSDNENVKPNFKSDRHFLVASAALENLDFILKSLLQEINGLSIPEEICIAFGGTPVMCKEVYRLILPISCHKPQCHSTLIANDQKLHMNVFRTLVTTEKLSQVFYNPLTPTNLYVFIKKQMLGSQESITSETFLYTSGYRIPRSTKIVVIDFRTQNREGINCCKQFEIFGDVPNNHQFHKSGVDDENDFHEIESTDTVKWYQASYVMKGFKDCVVNGSSITNSWLNS